MKKAVRTALSAIDELMLASYEVGSAMADIRRARRPTRKQYDALARAQRAEFDATSRVQKYVCKLGLPAKKRN